MIDIMLNTKVSMHRIQQKEKAKRHNHNAGRYGPVNVQFYHGCTKAYSEFENEKKVSIHQTVNERASDARMRVCVPKKVAAVRNHARNVRSFAFYCNILTFVSGQCNDQLEVYSIKTITKKIIFHIVSVICCSIKLKIESKHDGRHNWSSYNSVIIK